ncbi:putative 3-oxoacyl-[acyl-carrier-protein] reductase [Lupinus albus]|uniref:Putative 3-oxoacyl-[acyl-carrier-protein] reductase n=1 Tax=Lupinus albus TaxID=3870 RepID=A0A6A4NHA1_LUPAL|nr:putative 3-oxoacyl-[acyl-carrier-protein] reductase [Lupinus albus]
MGWKGLKIDNHTINFNVPLFLSYVGEVKSPVDLTEEDWHKEFKTNLTGTWLVSKYVCKRMQLALQKGIVINISSIAGLNRGSLPGSASYSASKAGVNSLTKVIFFYLQLIFKYNKQVISIGIVAGKAQLDYHKYQKVNVLITGSETY